MSGMQNHHHHHNNHHNDDDSDLMSDPRQRPSVIMSVDDDLDFGDDGVFDDWLVGSHNYSHDGRAI